MLETAFLTKPSTFLIEICQKYTLHVADFSWQHLLQPVKNNIEITGYFVF